MCAHLDNLTQPVASAPHAKESIPPQHAASVPLSQGAFPFFLRSSSSPTLATFSVEPPVAEPFSKVARPLSMTVVAEDTANQKSLGLQAVKTDGDVNNGAPMRKVGELMVQEQEGGAHHGIEMQGLGQIHQIISENRPGGAR